MRTNKYIIILRVLTVLLIGYYFYMKIPPNDVKVNISQNQELEIIHAIELGKRPRNLRLKYELEEDYYDQDLGRDDFYDWGRNEIREIYRVSLKEEKEFFQRRKRNKKVVAFSTPKELKKIYNKQKFKHSHNYEFVGINVEGYHLFYRNKKYGMLNTDGDIVIPSIYDNLDVLSEGLISAKKGNK